MFSLFSVFDFIFFYKNLLTYFFFFFFMFNIFYVSSSNSKILLLIYQTLGKFFYSLSKSHCSDFLASLSISLVIMLMCFNYFSVMSFNFPLSSLPSFVMFMSFSFWLTLFLMNLYSNFKGFLQHCIPEGSPFILSIFLFLIELISNIIRPLTLGIRMCANILSGHLLMVLLSKLVLSFVIFSPLYLILNMIEMFVALIQSYIFVTLLSLYFSEVK